jgi:polyisoprenoid-binding protein YceI
MSDGNVMKNKWTWIIGIPALVIVLVVGGTWLYINVIKDDPPPKLELSTVNTGGSTTTVPATDASIDGDWTVKSGSKVQYRVEEILFGQGTEGVGSTTAVTGSMTISGTTVETAEFTTDLTQVTSDEDNRDKQFQGRIMDTANFPNATFTLTEPIDLGTVPDNGEQVTVRATGDLTLRGTTKSVTFDIVAQRNGAAIEANGTIPVVFDEYGIPEPSFGPAQVGDTGDLEFLLTFEKS